ncbi:MAG: hypothetical protein ONA90_07170 [candidate division KSB1 bacterium]|nr:hypothetical protein [candidate division KSB1 bacterium]
MNRFTISITLDEYLVLLDTLPPVALFHFQLVEEPTLLTEDLERALPLRREGDPESREWLFVETRKEKTPTQCQRIRAWLALLL